MICDGDAVADIDVADETASPGLQEVVRAEYLCVVNISARARGLPQCFSQDVDVAIVYGAASTGRLQG